MIYLRLFAYTLFMPAIWMVAAATAVLGIPHAETPMRYLKSLSEEWREWVNDASNTQLNLIAFTLLVIWVLLPVSFVLRALP